jgi:hypothetical protein
MTIPKGWNAKRRGWGASTGSIYDGLIKSGAVMILDPNRPSGKPFTKLAPRTLPNGVSNGELTPQRVSMDVVITSGFVTNAVNRTNFTQAFINFSAFPQIPINGVDTVQGTFNIPNWIEKANSVSGAYVPNLFSTRSDNQLIFDVPLGTTLAQAQALLAGTVIRYELATPIDTLNSPFVNPLVDLANKVGKNLFDPITQHSQASANTTVSNLGRIIVTSTLSETFRFARYRVSNLNQGATVYIKTSSTRTGTSGGGIGVFTSGSVFLGADIDNVNSQVTVTVPSDGILDIRFYASGSVAEVTTSTFNTVMVSYENLAFVPYAKNNALLQNFIPSSVDGYDTIIAPNGKTVTVLNLDGTNSFGALASSDALNPVGNDDFAQLVVFSPENTIVGYHGVSRNGITGTDIQYGVLTIGSDLYYNVEQSELSVGKVTIGTLVYILFGRINGVRFLNVLQTERHSLLDNRSILSQANTQLYSRSDVSGKLRFAKGYQAFCAFWKAPNGQLDKNKIVAECAKFCAKQYGL